MTTKIETHTLIIGAGPAGITLAKTLAESGSMVTLVDAGGERFNNDTQQIYRAENKDPRYPDTTKSRLRQLGGTSNHWANNTSRLSKIDFEQRDWMGVPTWPISLSDLEPYYPEAEALCGVRGEGYRFSELSKVYGFTTPVRENNPYITTGFARAAIPPTRFFAKQKNTLEGLSTLTLMPNTELVNLLWDKSNKKVVGAVFYQDGNIVTIESECTVLCMGGIENARTLLIENNLHDNAIGNQGGAVGRYFMDHPTLPAANLFAKNDKLFESFKGRLSTDYSQFIVQFYELSEQLLLSEGLSNIRMPLERSTRMEISEGVSSLHSLRNILTGKGDVKYTLQHLSQAALEWDLVAQAAINKFNGPQIIKDADKLSGYQINMMMEQSPDPESRILLSGKKDKFGRPIAKVSWRLTDDDISRFWRGVEMFAHGIAFDGVGRARVLKHQADRLFNDQLGFAHHHMGSTRMSDSPEFGVVDRNLRVHGCENLYICGSSVFSTGSHVPPTLTITALSLRLANHLNEKKNG